MGNRFFQNPQVRQFVLFLFNINQFNCEKNPSTYIGETVSNRCDMAENIFHIALAIPHNTMDQDII